MSASVSETTSHDSRAAVAQDLATGGPVPPLAGRSSAKVRQTWIDQARWVAITLVVTGHCAGLVRGRSELASSFSDFVYLFHVPVLVLLAGWGARNAKAEAASLTKIFWQLLVPYAIFQSIAFGVNFLLEDDTPSWSYAYQTFGLWFLVTLAGWRLLGPWFRGFRHPWQLALGAALVAGLSPQIGSFLSLSRLFFFLPIFVAGPWIVDHVSLWRASLRLRGLGAVVLLAGAAWVTMSRPAFDRKIFLGDDGYASLQQGLLEGMAYRAGAIAVSTALAVALCLVLPGQPGASSTLGSAVARAGRHTMYPYLFHLPLLTVIGWTGWTQRGEPLAAALAAMGFGILVSVVMVTPPARALAQVLVEPRCILDWLSHRRRRR